MPRAQTHSGHRQVGQTGEKKIAAAVLVLQYPTVLCDSAAYLNNIYAGVQVDGSFGILAVLFILVGVKDVGAVGELRQVEVPPFEHLRFTAREKQVRVSDQRGLKTSQQRNVG